MRIFSDSAVVMSGVRITGGSAPSDNGGGILIDSAASLELVNSEISGNSATEGGGISAAGALTVRNSLIASNLATGAGNTGLGGGVALDVDPSSRPAW